MKVQMAPEKVCLIIGACAVPDNIAILQNEPIKDGFKRVPPKKVALFYFFSVLLQELCVVDGMILKLNRTAPPGSLREKSIGIAHKQGHLGYPRQKS